MLNVSPLSQRSEAWKNYRLGFGTGTIGRYGCLLVSYTMILNYFAKRSHTPLEVNEAMKAVGGYSGTTKNLWNWYVADSIFGTEYTVGSGNNYDDAEVKAWLKKGVPVIIKVDGKPIGGLSHYVVAIGDGKIADPWTGTIRPFSSYTPLGYHVYTYSGEEPMNELETCMKDREKFWKERDEAREALEEAKKEIGLADEFIVKKTNEIVKLELEIDGMKPVVAEMDKIKAAYGLKTFDDVDKYIRSLKEEIAITQTVEDPEPAPMPTPDTTTKPATVVVKIPVIGRILDFIKNWFTINREQK